MITEIKKVIMEKGILESGITALIIFQGNSYTIESNNWFAFLKDINEMMREWKTTYEIGENGDTKKVTKKMGDVPEWKNGNS